MHTRVLHQSILIFALFCVLSTSAQATIYYVDQSNTSGIEDGLSWSTAFTDLQDALTLNALTAGDDILVAEGIYVPSDVGDPDISFELVDGVELKGGYPSGGGVRNPTANTTILDGEEITYSVIFSSGVSAATVVDGFTITGGESSGSCSGGGASARQKFGGGWFNIDGSPTVNYCIFEGNSSGCNGGAMYNDGGSGKYCDPVYTNCEFNGNYGRLAGGAIYNNGNGGNATSTFYNCKLISNGTRRDSTAYGGAVYNFGKNGNGNSLYVNCVIALNSGFAGTGIYNLGSHGGQANPTIINALFFGNNSALSAGALYTNAGSTSNLGTSIATVENSIFWDNIAAPYGGDLFKINNGGINLTNCIIQGADCTEAAAGNEDPNCISGILYDTNPQLDDPYNDNYSLTSNSPAINMGDGSLNPLPMDLDGMSRIQQSQIDLGPLESPFAPLAIELIDFSANIDGESVQLNWSTSIEINHDIFEIEKSTDGIHYKAIGSQVGLNKTGVKTEYNFTDHTPSEGVNYYRINALDYSKNSKISPVRNVVFSINTISLFPNPTDYHINIQADRNVKSDIDYFISNAQGKIMARGIITSRNYNLLETIPIPDHWDSGLYFLQFDPSKLPNSTPLKFNVVRTN